MSFYNDDQDYTANSDNIVYDDDSEDDFNSNNDIEQQERLRELDDEQNRYIQKMYDQGQIIDYKKNNILNGNGKIKEKKKQQQQLTKTLQKIIKTKNTNNDTSKQSDNNKEIIEKEDNEDEKEETVENANAFIFKFVEDYVQLLFKDQFGKLFARVKINDTSNYDLMSLTTHKFERYISKIFYETDYKIILPKEKRNDIIEHLQYKAEFSGITKKLDLRVAKTEDDDYTFYYDLTNVNEGITAIKITSEGWTFENNPPVLFRRYSNQLPQVNPSHSSLLTADGKDDRILDKFIDLLNVKGDDNKLLLKCYIISLLVPDIAKPILMLHGEQGSAKSTLQELIKMLVDPSIVKTLTFPRDINELIQQLSHNYIAYFDNVSHIKESISDALCRAVTGSGFSKRQLYTDDDDIIYNFKRCIGFNGINLGATKADLLDRGIIIQLERIPKERRRKLEEIWKEFEILRPYLLEYIFDILVKVFQVKKKGGITIPNGLNRMADFEEYAEIISRCMGYQEGEFLRVYQDNIGVQIDEAIESSPLSQAILELMNFKEKNEGQKTLTNTPTELLIELENIAVTKLNLSVSKIKSWPKSASHLTRKINEIKTNLREKGIEITIGKDQGKRITTISKVPSLPSLPSNTTASNTKQDERIDSKSNLEQVPSKMPSKENGEKRA